MSNYYDYGATGRGFSVDANGKILLNASPSATGNAFEYGATGRKIKVDSDGKLLVNIEGISTSGDLATVSGVLNNKITDNDVDLATLETASGVLRSDVDSNDTDIAELQAVSGVNKVQEVLAAVDLAKSGDLYHQTFNHELGDRFVVVQYYDTSTYESGPSGVYHVLTDANNAEIWTPTSGDLGVIASR